MTDEIDQMREFILLSEGLLIVPDPQPEPAETIVEAAQSARHPIIDDLSDLVFRLRSLMESGGGEYAFGVESGMRRAAEWIENLINRHEENQIGPQI